MQVCLEQNYSGNFIATPRTSWVKNNRIIEMFNVHHNPARGMDVCPRVSVLCCPVSVEAFRPADPPAKESYQNVSYVDREAR
jgi:hypothetical protein